METVHAIDFSSQCSSLPGSRATPAPRNDRILASNHILLRFLASGNDQWPGIFSALCRFSTHSNVLDRRTLLDRGKSSRGHHDSRRVRGTLLAHSAVGPPNLSGVQRKRSDATAAADLGRRSHGRGPVDYLRRCPSPPWPNDDRSGTKISDDRFRRVQTFSLRQVGERCYPRPQPDWVRKSGFIDG